MYFEISPFRIPWTFSRQPLSRIQQNTTSYRIELNVAIRNQMSFLLKIKSIFQHIHTTMHGSAGSSMRYQTYSIVYRWHFLIYLYRMLSEWLVLKACTRKHSHTFRNSIVLTISYRMHPWYFNFKSVLSIDNPRQSNGPDCVE